MKASIMVIEKCVPTAGNVLLAGVLEVSAACHEHKNIYAHNEKYIMKHREACAASSRKS